ncbi:MAG: hypothetical protein FJ189_09395 [Gammaproteobacteria bacterium]|nr:hypothetical protein [Gammaproteobacteria bacterium]
MIRAEHPSARGCSALNEPIMAFFQSLPTGRAARLVCLIQVLGLLIMGLATAGAEEAIIEVRAYAAYVNDSGFADWLIPDYVVRFRVPKGAQWTVFPTTERARAALAGIGPTLSSQVVGGSIEIVVVAGGRARRAGGYGRRNAWEYADELRVRYRSPPRS